MVSEQKGIKDLTAAISGSSANLAAAAALLALGGLALPFIGMQTNLGMGLDQAGSINGFTAAGWTAWVALLTFVGAAVARRVPAVSAYRNLIDMAALIMVVVAIAWAWFFNPVAAELKQLEEGFSFGRSDMPKMATMYPHVGIALLLLAGVALVFARRKD